MKSEISGPIAVLGIFVADASFRGTRLPKMGETLLGDAFHLSPGGKGSNQAVAAARAGKDAGGMVGFVGKLGQDAFATLAYELWKQAGVIPHVTVGEHATGAAAIFIETHTGNNAIIVCPSIGTAFREEELEPHRQVIESAQIFLTQLEVPIEVAQAGLKMAREAGGVTILNPAPARPLEDNMLKLCHYVTPNETEAEAMTGITVDSMEGARRAAEILCEKGVGCAIITLGERGAYVHGHAHGGERGEISTLIPAIKVEKIVETTGAGDAFNGGFAVALAEGKDVIQAVQFGCATAGLSVTKKGAADSMPTRKDIEQWLK